MNKYLCIYNDWSHIQVGVIFAENEEKARTLFVLSSDLIKCYINDKDDIIEYLKQVKDPDYESEVSEFDDNPIPDYIGGYVSVYNLDDMIYSKILGYNNQFVPIRYRIKNKLSLKHIAEKNEKLRRN